MEDLYKTIEKQPVIYITRDIERALGMEPKNGYFVISNDTSYGREIQKKYPNNVVLCTKHPALSMKDTYDLLLEPEVQEIISKHNASILVFQNNSRIERLAKEKDWRLLNPSAKLSKTVEEKISQVKWLGSLSSLLPPHQISKLSTTNYPPAMQGQALRAGKLKTSPFVLQFNHAHTGGGTHIINSLEKLEKLKSKFPDREARITDFIDGPVFTVNSLVCDKKTLVGNISYQITGLPPFTENPFATIGNDWSLPHKILSKKELEEIKKMAVAVGDSLEKDGWRGLFGIDVIQDAKTRKIYLLEINARQPASTTFESILQKQTDSSGISVFESHLSSLLSPLSTTNYPPAMQGQALRAGQPSTIPSGAQIILRHSNPPRRIKISSVRKNLEIAGFDVIIYDNPATGKELLRIQSRSGLMESHNVFSSEGKKLQDIIKKL